MENVVIPVPEGYEVIDLKFQLKPCKKAVKKIPVAIKPKCCDLCRGPRDNGYEICARCTMRQYNDMLGPNAFCQC